MAKWLNKIVNALDDAKDTLVGTIKKVAGKLGKVVDTQAVADKVDAVTDKLEAPLAELIRAQFPFLPEALAKGAAKHALDYIDAAVAGFLSAENK